MARLISAFVLALFLDWMRAEVAHLGAMTGFHVWLGFVASTCRSSSPLKTVQFTRALFTQQSMKLFATNSGYQLVCSVVMGAVLGSWR